MDRKALRAGVLAACCVVAIALVAASLSSPVVVEDADDDGFVVGDDSDIGVGEGGHWLFSPGPAEAPPDQEEFGLFPAFVSEVCPPDTPRPGLLLLVLLSYLAIGAVVARLFGFGAAVTIVSVFLMVTFLAMLVMLAGCPWEWPMQEQSFGIGEEDGSILPEQGEGDQAGTQPIATPTIVLVALLVVTLLGVLTALYVGGSDSEEEEAEPDEMPEPDDPSRIGAVAGRAADELEDEAELENAVYRAWVDMTAELPVDRPETSTPGEFATAATEAGMDPDDVAELTSLFEAVRYGNADVTDARERRAIETLRRIEATYTEGDRS